MSREAHTGQRLGIVLYLQALNALLSLPLLGHDILL